LGFDLRPFAFLERNTPPSLEHLHAFNCDRRPHRVRQQQIAGARMHLEHAAEGADHEALSGAIERHFGRRAHRPDQHALAGSLDKPGCIYKMRSRVVAIASQSGETARSPADRSTG
jgi:hypothetical protein